MKSWQSGRNPRLAILEAAATSSTWNPKIYFIQMARHRKSSLYGRGIAGFDECIQKKIPHNLAVLSSSLMLWSDNVIWNSCIQLFCERLSSYKSVYCGWWWLTALWSKLRGFELDRRKQHKHMHSSLSFFIAENTVNPTATHKTERYYRVHFCVFEEQPFLN